MKDKSAFHSKDEGSLRTREHSKDLSSQWNVFLELFQRRVMPVSLWAFYAFHPHIR